MAQPSLPSFLLRASVATLALAWGVAACGSSGSGGAASGAGGDAGGSARSDSGSGSDSSSAEGETGAGDSAADSHAADGASDSGKEGGGPAPAPACTSGDRTELSGTIPGTAITVAVCSVCGASYVVASNGGSSAGQVSVANGTKTITVDVAAGAKATSANLPDSPTDGTVTVCAETPSHACLAKNPQNQRYCNPYRDVANLVRERIDQGVDYGGAGPIYAMGPGTIDVFKNRNDTGWPGGTFMSYKLTAGPAAGKTIYLAENIDLDASLASGSFVYSGTALGTLVDASPDSESGWGVPGSGATAEYGCYTEGCMTPLGVNFNTLLVCLQAPSGTMGTGGCCPQPTGWPSDWCTELAAWQ
ncbi:MAG TPA: hypothetical protein VIF09_08055 [Polyangiaceae bacterium]|jgi:hypothetical protein